MKFTLMRSITLSYSLRGRRPVAHASVIQRKHWRSISGIVNPVWLEDMYLNIQTTAPEYMGAVQVVELPNKGRGVVATDDLQPGQLLLSSKPLAYSTTPMGSIPPPEELASVIRRSTYGPEDMQTLKSLFSGLDSDNDGGGEDEELDDWRLLGIIGCNSFGEEFTDFPTCQARKSGNPTRGNNADQKSCIPSSRPNESSSVVSGAAECVPATDEQVGHLALFPSFSMLNHSCLPNAVNFVVGGRMLVVAARNVTKGSEVLINYLGRASLRPVSERQAQLADGYYFSCDCPRCRTELLYSCTGPGVAGSSPPLSTVLQDILARCDKRSAVLEELGAAAAAAAATPSDSCSAANTAASLNGLLQSVRDDVRQWDEVLQRTRLPLEAPNDVADALAAAGGGGDGGVEVGRQWMQASAFDLYSQYAALADAAGQRCDALATVRQQVAICEAVAPSSDLHMYLAVNVALMAEGQKQQMIGGGDVGGNVAGQSFEKADHRETVMHADDVEWQRCLEVLRRRYGAGLSDDVLAVLLRGAVYGLTRVVV